MRVYDVIMSVESQLKNQTNYVQNNAIRICNDALKIYCLSEEKIDIIKSLKKEIEEITNPWQWNGIPSQKETHLILSCLIDLKMLLEEI